MERIRLSVKELALRAGVHEDTVHRVLRGLHDSRLSTLKAIETALSRAETELRTQLDPDAPLHDASVPSAAALTPRRETGGAPLPGSDTGEPPAVVPPATAERLMTLRCSACNHRFPANPDLGLGAIACPACGSSADQVFIAREVA
jgi:transcriptional regulator with XRE-family HTH domain/DNA-directed RNA polymerase subunit RPC12/RpoP